MDTLSTPLCFRSLTIYAELFAIANGNAACLEDYLSQVELAENFSREQALELVWRDLKFFKKMISSCYCQNSEDKELRR